MENSHSRKFQKDLNAGLTALVVLALLSTCSEDLYGYEIARRLKHTRPGEGLFRQGTIYPVLRSLAAAGLLSRRIVPSYAGPPRRYYRITAEGRLALADWQRLWGQTRDFVDHCLEG